MPSKFTELSVKNAKPRDKKYKLSDGAMGLYLDVRPNGAKYWIFRYPGNKECGLGVYPKVSLREARIAAAHHQKMVDRGDDPLKLRKESKEQAIRSSTLTLGYAAEEWFSWRKSWSSSTKVQVRRSLDKDLLRTIGSRHLDSISTMDLASFIDAIHMRGAPDIAKKMRQWLAQIYSHARARGFTSADPTKDLSSLLDLPSVARNYPHLKIDDIPEFLRRLDLVPASPLVKGALWLLLLWTANRPGVTCSLRWSEIDFHKREWAVPQGRERMKLGYEHVWPLPPQAVAMLRELQKISGELEHVFPGRNDPKVPMSNGAINQLLKRIGYRGKQTAHGFRHLISTYLNEQGYASDDIERQLSHLARDKTRATYNKAVWLDRRRTMMESWANKLDQCRSDPDLPHIDLSRDVRGSPVAAFATDAREA